MEDIKKKQKKGKVNYKIGEQKGRKEGEMDGKSRGVIYCDYITESPLLSEYLNWT